MFGEVLKDFFQEKWVSLSLNMESESLPASHLSLFLVKMVDLGKVLFMLMSQFGEDPFLTRNPVSMAVQNC